LLVVDIWSRLESRAKTQNSSTGNVEKDTEDNLVTGFPKNHNHPPAPSEINAKKFMAHIKERACTSLDPIKF
jgi:RNase H-fold protein (predicted Holliday junction resolvase)